MASDYFNDVRSALAASDLDTATMKLLRERLPERSCEVEQPHDPGLYVNSITVRGFRGIGRKSDLRLQAGNGLTFVLGANGSGKSSFAEALECALTGTTRRWEQATKAGRENWKNVDCSKPPLVDVTFRSDKLSTTLKLQARWGREDSLTDATVKFQQSDQEIAGSVDYDSLRQEALTVRPILAHSEIDKLASERPSKLFEAINPLLGLQQIESIRNSMDDDRLELAKQKKALSEAKSRFFQAANQVEDSNFASGLQACQLPSQAAVVVNEAFNVAQLRTVCDVDEAILNIGWQPIYDQVGKLTALAKRQQQLQQSTSLVSADARHVLALAVSMFEGGTLCPVCGSPTLTDRWHSKASALLADHQDLFKVDASIRQTKAALATAIDTIGQIVGSRHSADLIERSAIKELLALNNFAEIRRRCVDVAKRVDVAKQRFQELLGERQNEYSEVFDALRSWEQCFAEVEDNAPLLRNLEKACGWLAVQIDGLRSERMRNIGDRLISYWSQLTPDGDVSLDGIKLTGRRTRRELKIDGSLGDHAVKVQSVLSQGQLHALALSLFLPRTTTTGSPFRFLVIDDPVQAFDATRISGLLSILEDVAKERQVVVFTHDTRLPKIAETLGIESTLVSVTRRANSDVVTKGEKSKAERSLRDAQEVADSAELNEKTKLAVVCGLCAEAVEAAACATFRSTTFAEREASDHALDEAEATIAATHLLWDKVSLGLTGRASKRTEILVAERFGEKPASVIGTLNQGRHGDFISPVDPAQLVTDTRQTIKTLFKEQLVR